MESHLSQSNGFARHLRKVDVHLRVLQRDDVSARYLEWFHDVQVSRYLELAQQPSTIQELREYVQSCLDDASTVLFGIFQSSTNTHIGNIKVGPRLDLHQTASVGILIGDRNFWGRGFATTAIALASDWAFAEWSCVKLNAGCQAQNWASIAAFRRAGYRVEGWQADQVATSGSADRSDVVLLGRTRDQSLSDETTWRSDFVGIEQ